MNQQTALIQASQASQWTASVSPVRLQRACGCGERAGVSGVCPSCADGTRYGAARGLQRQQQRVGSDMAPPIVNQTLARSGTPLDAATRSIFEPRFGQPLDHVRIHTDAMAAESAAAVGAYAYTVGRHIVFGDGQWQPHSDSGQRILAHELGHVFQQRGADVPSGPIAIGRPGDQFERAADAIAEQVTGAATDAAAAGPSVQRLSMLSTGSPLVQRGECDQAGKYPVDRCAKGRSCGYGKSGTCGWGGLSIGCRCMGAQQPSILKILSILAIIGASLALAVLVVAALLDPEPGTKLVLAGLSLVQAVTLLVMLGYSEQQIRDMGLDPSLSTASNDALPPPDGTMMA
jgi:Domain of unknown function (DUF4157)